MRKALVENCIVTCLFLIIGIIATWPLIEHFNAAIPCRTTSGVMYLNKPGDHLQLLYWFWLLKDNIFGSSGFMQNPYEFNMVAAQPPDGLYMYPFNFLYLLFAPFGDIAAYNCLVLASYVLTGLFTYLLVKTCTGSRTGALVAACIYTLVPIRIINLLGGHLNGFIYFLLPAILYFFEKAYRSKSLVAACLCGLSIWWLSLLEVHLIYYMCVFLGLYLPFRVFFFTHNSSTERGRYTANPAMAPAVQLVPGMRWALINIYTIGVGVTCFYQALISWKFHHQFFTDNFWIILGPYPILFLFAVLLLAALLTQIFELSFQRAIRFYSVLLLPCYLLPLYAFNLSLKVEGLDKYLAGSVIVLMIISGWIGGKKYLQGLRCRQPLLWQRMGKQQIRLLVPVGIGLFLTVGWVFLVKKVFFSGTIAQGGRTIQDVKLFSPHLQDLYTPGSDVYFGLIPLLLLLYFFIVLVRWVQKPDHLYDRDQLSLVCFFSFSFLLAYLLGAGLSFGSSSIYTFFFDHFPFFNYPRVPDRIMTIAFLCGSVLIGYAVRDLLLRFWAPGNRVFLSCMLASLMAILWFDFGVGKPVGLTNLDRGQEVYRYIKENIDDKLLLEIPLWPGDSHQSSLYEYYTTMDTLHRVNGYTPIVTQEYIEQVYRPLSTLNMGVLDSEQYHLLKKMGVRFVTVHDNPAVFPRRVSPFPPIMTVRRLMNSPYLEYIPLRNMVQLPGTVRENRKLYLFRVVETIDAGKLETQASTCRFFIPNVYPATSLGHVTGTQVLDQSINKQVLHAAPGRDVEDYLSYGPYEEYPSGEYEVRYRLRINKPGVDAKVARLEISTFVDHDKQQLLVSREISGKDFNNQGYHDFILHFTLPQLQKMEFRIWYYGTTELWLEKIIVTCAGRKSYDTVFEAEALLGDIGNLSQDPTASGGKGITATALTDKVGRMVYGPFRTYAPGKYKVTYFMKSPSAATVDTRQPLVAYCKITSDEGQTALAGRTVKFTDIIGQTYRPVSLTFALHRDNELSFELHFNGQADLQIDRVEIKRLGPASSTFVPGLFLIKEKHGKKSTAAGR